MPTSKSKAGGSSNDEDLAIGLGVTLGFLAIAIPAVIFWIIWRRRRRTGRYYLREGTPAPEDSPTWESGKDEKPFGPDESANGSIGAPAEGYSRGEYSTEVAGKGTRDMEPPATSNSNPPEPPLFFENPSLRQGGERTSYEQPGFQNPSLRHGSQRTSYEQPFYTPAEGRSFSFAETDGTQSTYIPDEPPPVPPTDTAQQDFGAPRPESGTLNQNPFSEGDRPASMQDVGTGFVSGQDESQRDSGMSPIHYPPSSEVDRFDFSGLEDQSRPHSEGSWMSSGLRKDGRFELQ